MKAMILAAGEGRRMHPLTLDTPKPLLRIAGRSLIEYQIDRLIQAGIQDVVVNISYLGDKIIDVLGDGSHYGIAIHYSKEASPLETGGAINKALPLLGDDPILLVNADVWCEFPYAGLVNREEEFRSLLAYLVLVDNPSHNSDGDFCFADNRFVEMKCQYRQNFTYSGISIINPTLFRDFPDRKEKFPLKSVLDWGIEKKRVRGEVYSGKWVDVGTPERLKWLETSL